MVQSGPNLITTVINMIYYLFFLFASFVATCDLLKTPIVYKKIIATFIGILTIIFAGIRWRTGTDWEPYLNIFSYSDNFEIFMSQGYETLFLLVNFISKYIYNSYTIYLFIIATIVVVLKYSTFFKISRYPLICILASMAFYSMDMFTVRQGIAIAITIFSLRYITQNEQSKAKFIFCVIVASGFHITALVFIPAYLIFKMKSSISRIILITCIAAIISMLFGAANILGLMISYLPSFISMKITRYLALQDLNAFSEIPSEVRRAIGYAKRILFVVVFAWATYGMRNDDEGRTIRGMFNLFAFSSIMFMLLDSVHPVFSRLAMYYSASEIFLVSSVLYRFRKNAGIFIIYSVIVLYLISRLIYGFNNHPDLFYPYETIFQHSWKEVY